MKNPQCDIVCDFFKVIQNKIVLFFIIKTNTKKNKWSTCFLEEFINNIIIILS